MASQGWHAILTEGYQVPGLRVCKPTWFQVGINQPKKSEMIYTLLLNVPGNIGRTIY